MSDNAHTPSTLGLGEPDKASSIIKIIGVGGGGGSVVNHMYREDIHDVTFMLCSTDNQALNDNPVPLHLQLGKEGLGAGSKPEKARLAVEESLEDIKSILNDGTRMTFITVGIGGGTDTGAAPVITRVSKELGILTVGIVTVPFRFEGNKKISQTLDGVEGMAKHMNALLVINSEWLRGIYPDPTVLDAFGRANNTLSIAAKNITEIVTNHELISLDFNDVETVPKDGSVTIMSTGFGESEGRVRAAIEDILNSPLLNDNDIFNSKRILLSINFCNEKDDNNGLMMGEMNDVNDFMEHFDSDLEIKWGIAVDLDLGKEVKVTILTIGLGISDVEGMDSHIGKRHSQEEAMHLAEGEERKVRLINRREQYYKDGKNSKYKRHPHVYLFSNEGPDNEDVILAVESFPTYKRAHQMLDDIHKQASGEPRGPEQRENGEPIQGFISFE